MNSIDKENKRVLKDIGTGRGWFVYDTQHVYVLPKKAHVKQHQFAGEAHKIWAQLHDTVMSGLAHQLDQDPHTPASIEVKRYGKRRGDYILVDGFPNSEVELAIKAAVRRISTKNVRRSTE